MTIWDERYGSDEFFYGTEPNDFLREQAQLLVPKAEVLCLAEGEGRNAVYLAGLGHRVTAVDASPVGIDKLRRFATLRGVQVSAVVSDLAQFVIEPARWDAVVSIWCHIPEALRATVYRACVAGLRPGGHLIVEAYHPRQLQFKTGGPPTADLMVTLPMLQHELAGLEVLLAQEIERTVREGRGHQGHSAVVQFIGRKPKYVWFYFCI